MRGLPFFFVKERRFVFERAPFLFREERELILIWSVSPRHGRSKDFSVPSPLLRRRESFVISDKNEHETGRRKRTAVGGNKTYENQGDSLSLAIGVCTEWRGSSLREGAKGIARSRHLLHRSRRTRLLPQGITGMNIRIRYARRREARFRVPKDLQVFPPSHR